MEFGGLNVKTAIKGLGAVDAGSSHPARPQFYTENNDDGSMIH